jgi:hypothetical protein
VAPVASDPSVSARLTAASLDEETGPDADEAEVAAVTSESPLALVRAARAAAAAFASSAGSVPFVAGRAGVVEISARVDDVNEPFVSLALPVVRAALSAAVAASPLELWPLPEARALGSAPTVGAAERPEGGTVDDGTLDAGEVATAAVSLSSLSSSSAVSSSAGAGPPAVEAAVPVVSGCGEASFAAPSQPWTAASVTPELEFAETGAVPAADAPCDPPALDPTAAGTGAGAGGGTLPVDGKDAPPVSAAEDLASALRLDFRDTCCIVPAKFEALGASLVESPVLLEGGAESRAGDAVTAGMTGTWKFGIVGFMP